MQDEIHILMDYRCHNTSLLFFQMKKGKTCSIKCEVNILSMNLARNKCQSILKYLHLIQLPFPRGGVARIPYSMPVSVMCRKRKLFFMNQGIPLEGGRSQGETWKKFLAPAV